MATAPASDGGGLPQRGWVAPVDDEGPTVVGQGAGEGEAEAA